MYLSCPWCIALQLLALQRRTSEWQLWLSASSSSKVWWRWPWRRWWGSSGLPLSLHTLAPGHPDLALFLEPFDESLSTIHARWILYKIRYVLICFLAYWFASFQSWFLMAFLIDNVSTKTAIWQRSCAIQSCGQGVCNSSQGHCWLMQILWKL